MFWKDDKKLFVFQNMQKLLYYLDFTEKNEY